MTKQKILEELHKEKEKCRKLTPAEIGYAAGIGKAIELVEQFDESRKQINEKDFADLVGEIRTYWVDTVDDYELEPAAGEIEDILKKYLKPQSLISELEKQKDEALEHFNIIRASELIAEIDELKSKNIDKEVKTVAELIIENNTLKELYRQEYDLRKRFQQKYREVERQFIVSDKPIN